MIFEALSQPIAAVAWARDVTRRPGATPHLAAATAGAPAPASAG